MLIRVILFAVSFQRILTFASLCALATWLGGLTFYSAFVIPVGHGVLGSHREVGFITREVTVFLNGVGVVALVLAWLMLLRGSALGYGSRRLKVWLLSIMSVLMVALVGLHPVLDGHLDTVTRSIDAPDTFYQLHRVYLLLTTVQWLAGAGLVWCVCLRVDQVVANGVQERGDRG